MSQTIEGNGVTFRIEGTAKQLADATAEQLKRAYVDLAFKWHELATKHVTEMVYNTPEPAAAKGQVGFGSTPGRGGYLRTGRLRASIAWAIPNQAYTHSKPFRGGVVTYSVPAAESNTVMVGTNVEYAPAVHDGLNQTSVTVRAHTRRITSAFGKPITQKLVNVQSHTRLQPARAAKPFISRAGLDLVPLAPNIITRALAGDPAS